MIHDNDPYGHLDIIMTRSLQEIRLMALAGAMTAIGALPALAEEWNGAYAGAHASARLDWLVQPEPFSTCARAVYADAWRAI